MPTNQFWTLAFVTPISLVFWAGAAVFLLWVHSFAWVWWHKALAFLLFYAVYGGLVERWSRRALARRQRRAFASQALVPSPAPRRALPVVATAEYWDHAFARTFGRAAGVVQLSFDFAVFMALCHPAWQVFCSTIAGLLLLSFGLGARQRRELRQINGATSPARMQLAAPADWEGDGPAGSSD
ncbi:hypothetical protein [Nannocystis punicea]|uniref:Glycosyl-4,4'-diaponeurosporenoate acyltransferase n=1 Tax=Nannocystis punicea TaxID=2995304 RepID=A0ABY7H7X7_9BACT|nr:hypothetical protein [Nannocystis poenicansa]WAS95366.1 hypothetical protein O0S08_04330 [Nannocystis poenicansa]